MLEIREAIYILAQHFHLCPHTGMHIGTHTPQLLKASLVLDQWGGGADPGHPLLILSSPPASFFRIKKTIFLSPRLLTTSSYHPRDGI